MYKIIKRTIPTTIFSVALYDEEKEIVEKVEKEMVGDWSKKKAKAHKIFQNEFEKPVVCTSIESVKEVTYQMTVDEFIENATVVEN